MLNRGALSDPRPGHFLRSGVQTRLWWCESGWKIGRDAPPPDAAGSEKPLMTVSAARGEYEALQLILTPNTTNECTLLSAQTGVLRGSGGKEAPISATISEVAYVRVTHPTDRTCERGWYPDPLPPLRTPLKWRGPANQPLWLTFHVPRETQPGDYSGELELRSPPEAEIHAG